MARRLHVCFAHILPFVAETDSTLQVISCRGMPNIGIPLPTHRRITTSFGKRITLELHRGSLKVIH